MDIVHLNDLQMTRDFDAVGFFLFSYRNVYYLLTIGGSILLLVAEPSFIYENCSGSHCHEQLMITGVMAKGTFSQIYSNNARNKRSPNATSTPL